MTWHYFNLSTGLFEGRIYRCSDPSQLPPKIAGKGVIQGVSDWKSQRVDVTADPWVIVDYVPPRPDDDHYWDPGSRRWLLSPIVAESLARRTEIIQRIKELDERLIRPMAELFDNPQDTEAREIYSKLKTEKDTLRAELKALSGPK